MQPQSSTISAKEAAKYLGISYWLLLDLVRRKQIPNIRLENRLLFRVESLEQFLINMEMQSIQPVEEIEQAKGIRPIKV